MTTAVQSSPRSNRLRRRLAEVGGWLVAVSLSVSAAMGMHALSARPFHTTLEDPLALPRELTDRAQIPGVPLPPVTAPVPGSQAGVTSSAVPVPTGPVASTSTTGLPAFSPPSGLPVSVAGESPTVTVQLASSRTQRAVATSPTATTAPVTAAPVRTAPVTSPPATSPPTTEPPVILVDAQTTQSIIDELRGRGRTPNPISGVLNSSNSGNSDSKGNGE